MTALSALRAFSKPPLVMMYLLRAAANHEAPHISLRLARRNDSAYPLHLKPELASTTSRR
jgi:hypothetical protein